MNNRFTPFLNIEISFDLKMLDKRMKRIIQTLIFFSLLTFPLLSSSQTRKLSGTVLSFNKYPVKGVTVKAKKAKTEAVTNEVGEFEIEVKTKDVLRIKESVFMEYNYR